MSVGSLSIRALLAHRILSLLRMVNVSLKKASFFWRRLGSARYARTRPYATIKAASKMAMAMPKVLPSVSSQCSQRARSAPRAAK